MRWRALASATCVWMAACTLVPAAPVTFGADVDAIASAEHEINQRAEARDVDALMALYHPNAAMIAPNGQRLTLADIRRYYEAMADDPNARLEIERATIIEAAAGGLAYSSGAYTEMYAGAEPGSVRIVSGQSLRVWKRENEAWRIVLETRTVQDRRGD